MNNKVVLVVLPLIAALVGCNSGSSNNNGNMLQSAGANNAKQLSVSQITASGDQTSYTWMSGESKLSAVGIYGTKGVASTANYPKARSNYAMWTDNSGNVWIFGGESGTELYKRYYNDMWKYNPNDKTWKWVSGSNTANVAAVFGKKGTAAKTNTPASKSDAYTWKDKDGNLWLFGGTSYIPQTGISITATYYNDLWKFDVSTEQWTWISGTNLSNQPSIYSVTARAESSGNAPGSRYQGSTWSDESGNFWLFGGTSRESSATDVIVVRNDLWRFNVATKQWALMSPISTAKYMNAKNKTILVGSYGTLGVASATNIPGGRTMAPATWTDRSGNLWLFGGQETGAANLYKNDLWKFNPNTNQWTWMGGSQGSDQASVYGSLGAESSGNIPCSRSAAASWVDTSGNFWLYGGNNSCGASGGGSGIGADLWRYNVSTGMWALIGGSQTLSGVLPTYGTKGTSSNSFVGSRMFSNAKVDNTGNVWLFGGKITSDYSGVGADLWKINPVNVSLKLEQLPASSIKWNNSLIDIPGNQFGLYGVLFTNQSSFQLESINVAGKFPSNEFSFDLYRSTCLVSGTSKSIVLAPNASCSLVIRYQPTVSSYTGVLQFAAQAKAVNSTPIYTTGAVSITYSSRSYAKCNITESSWSKCSY